MFYFSRFLLALSACYQQPLEVVDISRIGYRKNAIKRAIKIGIKLYCTVTVLVVNLHLFTKICWELYSCKLYLSMTNKKCTYTSQWRIKIFILVALH